MAQLVECSDEFDEQNEQSNEKMGMHFVRRHNDYVKYEWPPKNIGLLKVTNFLKVIF